MAVDIIDRGNVLVISGNEESVRSAQVVLDALWQKAIRGEDIGTGEVEAALRFHLHDNKKGNHVESDSSNKTNRESYMQNFSDKNHGVKTGKGIIPLRSPVQQDYVNAIRKHDLVFGIGPAGTGKTYLAVAMAVNAWNNGDVERIVFCRPAIEAGEKIGFLPGDMKEKVDPYLRPIYDSLHDMLPSDIIQKKMDSGELEIAPLAFMRGRTLRNSFVILDEAQNATSLQMRMMLTRMGERSKMVITGDPSQSDLPSGTSGLNEAINVLRNIDEIGFIKFTGEDVVRHPLVHKIVDAYDTHRKSS